MIALTIERNLLHIIIVLLAILLVSCAEQKDTCERDKINGDWGKIVDNEACSNTEKAEAYLALGGFNYFDFISGENQNLAAIIGLNSSNWLQKKGYFNSAVRLVSSLLSGSQKTIYLFGSFMGLFTHVTGNLDNGAGNGVAFDGNIESDETDFFAGTNLKSGGSGTSLTTTADYQFKINNSNQWYVLYSSISNIWGDDDGDGSGDSKLVGPMYTDVVSAVASEGLSQLNQIVYMESLEDPFASSANLNIDKVNSFANEILNYLNQIKTAINALNVDPSKDEIKQISKFQSDLDNGGECETLKNNPGLLLVQYFATNLQETAVTDYSSVNLLLASKLAEYGADATFDADNLSGTYGISDIGIKILFLKNDASGYIPYWSDATSDVKDTMEVFKNFDSNEIAVDGKIVFSEIICAPELMSKDN